MLELLPQFTQGTARLMNKVKLINGSNLKLVWIGEHEVSSGFAVDRRRHKPDPFYKLYNICDPYERKDLLFVPLTLLCSALIKCLIRFQSVSILILSLLYYRQWRFVVLNIHKKKTKTIFYIYLHLINNIELTLLVLLSCIFGPQYTFQITEAFFIPNIFTTLWK